MDGKQKLWNISEVVLNENRGKTYFRCKEIERPTSISNENRLYSILNCFQNSFLMIFYFCLYFVTNSICSLLYSMIYMDINTYKTDKASRSLLITVCLY